MCVWFSRQYSSLRLADIVDPRQPITDEANELGKAGVGSAHIHLTSCLAYGKPQDGGHHGQAD